VLIFVIILLWLQFLLLTDIQFPCNNLSSLVQSCRGLRFLEASIGCVFFGGGHYLNRNPLKSSLFTFSGF